jgi:quercetin dioxygenase-like cupin family protein
VTVRAGETGATLWRWELSFNGAAAPAADGKGAFSREKLSAQLETLPEGELLWRGDSVAFPAGGVAYLHRHQGPGIRCVIEGELRVDTNGHAHTYGIGEAWFESGPEPVFAQAGDRPTRFIRVMILPRALIGKSSIQYVNEDDKTKPKLQQYRVFVDTPLTRS